MRFFFYLCLPARLPPSPTVQSAVSFLVQPDTFTMTACSKNKGRGGQRRKERSQAGLQQPRPHTQPPSYQGGLHQICSCFTANPGQEPLPLQFISSQHRADGGGGDDSERKKKYIFYVPSCISNILSIFPCLQPFPAGCTAVS